MTCPARLGRLLTLHFIATWWVLATAPAATPVILDRIAMLRRRLGATDPSPGTAPAAHGDPVRRWMACSGSIA